MKIKIIFLLFLISAINFPWGEEGHRLIANKAIDLLKEKIPGIEQFQNYITEHSIDPDLRRDDDKSEFPKHFIDIDFYEEFLNGKMINDKEQLISIYGESTVTKMGLLPWTTIGTFNNLVKAFQEKDKDKVLLFSSDLAHYVGDAHQPMHTMLNYDGQLTNQKGIHSRYESKMIEKYLVELSNQNENSKVLYVDNTTDFIFDYISNSNSLSEVLLSSDKFANTKAASNNNDEYYRLLWFKTKYITKIQFESACNSLASLIFTAWVDAGKPSIDEINLD
ncbi:MAG TPA: S1/P1 nuclease [Ignavibacteriaceae bacterium]|nr:S1/P1 nuclease [Ignavibacteriaceae bacterium]